MSGETESQPIGWTVDTALRHMQVQHDALVVLLNERSVSQDREVQAALAAAEKAVTKAEIATDKRFDSVNEFRGTLSDLTQTLMPRAEAEAKFKSIEDKVGVGASQDSTDKGYHAGRVGIKSETYNIITTLIAIAAVIAVFLK